MLQVGFGVFALVCGLAFYARYNRHEREKMEMINALQKDRDMQEMATQLDYYKKSAENYKYKIGRLRTNYDVDFDDDEVDTQAPTNELVPTLLELAGDKLPPKLRAVIANPKVMDAVATTVQKHPDLIEKVAGWVANKSESNGNTPPAGPQYAI